MSTPTRRYSQAETARRGDEIYKRDIRAQVEGTHFGKIVAIDIDSGAYVISDTTLDAAKRLRSTYQDAVIWCVRIGHRAVPRMGGHPMPRNV